MKKIILGVAIAIAFPSVAFAAGGAKAECKCCKDMKELVHIVYNLNIIPFFFQND